ncbi:trehalase-like domain-containing protein [Hydrogenivirga caldilitoris]|uniref:trehalase-like domain-containing protein n=1 Tax=Hydrogenivirga caldilitoris TaxID=246264 RepID=UPI000EAC0986|nr:trehalase-like domain-containing protein [Hydrogenivirga caldilitoris]
MWKSIESYGVIGNGSTCALINSDGSVDWLCLPFFDSPSVFSAVLDPSAGYYSISSEEHQNLSLGYVEKTNILENVFSAYDHDILVTSFMPRGKDLLLRRVKCRRGSCNVRIRCYPKFNYGRDRPTVDFREENFTFYSGNEALHLKILWEPEHVKFDDGGVELTIKLRNGQSFWTLLSYGKPPRP